jgi:hypothetical protein
VKVNSHITPTSNINLAYSQMARMLKDNKNLNENINNSVNKSDSNVHSPFTGGMSFHQHNYKKNNLLSNFKNSRDNIGSANVSQRMSKSILQFNNLEIGGPEDLHMFNVDIAQNNKKLAYKFEVDVDENEII